MMRFKRFGASEWFKQLRLQYRVDTVEVNLNRHIYIGYAFGTQTNLPTVSTMCTSVCKIRTSWGQQKACPWFKWDVWDSSLSHHNLSGRNNLSGAGCPMFDSSGYHVPIAWWQLKQLKIHIMWAHPLAHWAKRAVLESTHFIFEISSAKNRAVRILHLGGALKQLLLLARGFCTARSCPYSFTDTEILFFLWLKTAWGHEFLLSRYFSCPHSF